MRAAFSRLPKIAFPAGIWLKWLSLLPCFFQGLFGDEPQLFRLRYQLVSLSRRFGHGRNTQHCQRDIGRKLPTARKYKIMAPHLNILSLLILVHLLQRILCQTAGVTILKRGCLFNCRPSWPHFPVQWTSTGISTGSPGLHSENIPWSPRAWRTSCFRKATPEFGGILKSYVTCAAPIFTIIIVKAHLNVAAGIPTR